MTNTATTSSLLICPSGQTAAYTPCFYDEYYIGATNVFGNWVYKWTLGEHYCFNPVKTIATSYDGTPFINHWVASWAQGLGYSYQGVDDSGTLGPRYYSWNGLTHGGVETWRKGHFEYCPAFGIHIGCLQKYPYLHMYQHGDGSIYVSGRAS